MTINIIAFLVGSMFSSLLMILSRTLISKTRNFEIPPHRYISYLSKIPLLKIFAVHPRNQQNKVVVTFFCIDIISGFFCNYLLLSIENPFIAGLQFSLFAFLAYMTIFSLQLAASKRHNFSGKDKKKRK